MKKPEVALVRLPISSTAELSASWKYCNRAKYLALFCGAHGYAEHEFYSV
jgi:hypothetical protein